MRQSDTELYETRYTRRSGLSGTHSHVVQVGEEAAARGARVRARRLSVQLCEEAAVVRLGRVLGPRHDAVEAIVRRELLDLALLVLAQRVARNVLAR